MLHFCTGVTLERTALLSAKSDSSKVVMCIINDITCVEEVSMRKIFRIRVNVRTKFLSLFYSELLRITMYKAPAKRSQHANATCRNIVGRNMLHAFGHRVAMCCDMLGVVSSNLKMVKFEPTTPNISQHSGQTHATCCAQQCCDMLRWHVAIVWLGLNLHLLHFLHW